MAKNTELKALANLAKNRLRNASYSNEKYTKINNINKNSYFYKNILSLKRVSGGVEYVTITNNEDTDFIKKVFDMLDTDEDIYNPIGRLTNQTYFESLDEIQKQFYILSMVDRYTKAKEMYQNNIKHFKK